MASRKPPLSGKPSRGPIGGPEKSNPVGLSIHGMAQRDELKFRRAQTGALLNLQRIQRQIERHMQEQFAAQELEDVTPAQANALMIIFEQGASITAGQLAARMSLSPVTVGRFVHALESRDWVERVPHPDDSRARLLKPTKKAFEKLQKFVAVSNAIQDRAFAGFDVDQVLRVAREISSIQRNLQDDDE